MKPNISGWIREYRHFVCYLFLIQDTWQKSNIARIAEEFILLRGYLSGNTWGIDAKIRLIPVC